MAGEAVRCSWAALGSLAVAGCTARGGLDVQLERTETLPVLGQDAGVPTGERAERLPGFGIAPAAPTEPEDAGVPEQDNVGKERLETADAGSMAPDIQDAGFAPPEVPRSTCGDGIIEAEETCDDLNPAFGDGCSECRVEPEFTCVGEPSVCAICGDGQASIVEGCDDGNRELGDGCDAECQPEAGHVWETESNDTQELAESLQLPGAGQQTVLHGDFVLARDRDFFKFEVTSLADVAVRVVDPAGSTDCAGILELHLLREGSSDDLAFSSDDCPQLDWRSNENLRQLEPGSYVLNLVQGGAPPVAYQLELEAAGVCGDGRVDASEECDDPASTECDVRCQRVPLCGDGWLDRPDEQCDDFNQLASDGCSPSCELELPVALEVEDRPGNVGDSEDELSEALEVVEPPFVVEGALPSDADLDRVQVEVQQEGVIRLQGFNSLVGSDCRSENTQLRLELAEDGLVQSAAVAYRTSSESCGATMANVQEGTYELRVSKVDFGSAAGSPYRVVSTILNFAGGEVEPHDEMALAQQLTGSDLFVRGAVDVEGSSDWYAIEVPGHARLHAEVLPGSFLELTCTGLSRDPHLSLYDEDGFLLSENDDANASQERYCSLLDATSVNSEQSQAASNPWGRSRVLYLEVRASDYATGTDGALFDYHLGVSVR